MSQEIIEEFMTQQNNYEPLTTVEIISHLPDAVRPPEGWFEFARSIEKAVLEKQTHRGIRVNAWDVNGYWRAWSISEDAPNATLILDKQE